MKDGQEMRNAIKSKTNGNTVYSEGRGHRFESCRVRQPKVPNPSVRGEGGHPGHCSRWRGSDQCGAARAGGGVICHKNLLSL